MFDKFAIDSNTPEPLTCVFLRENEGGSYGGSKQVDLHINLNSLNLKRRTTF